MIKDILKDAETRMGKSVESLRHELTRLRTGRASSALVDHIKVSYYGSDMPLSQVASVAATDGRTLTITPWEKNMVGPVEKAILASDLGITPTTAGTVIRINIPACESPGRAEERGTIGQGFTFEPLGKRRCRLGFGHRAMPMRSMFERHSMSWVRLNKRRCTPCVITR